MSVCEIKSKSNDERDRKGDGWAHFIFSQLISLNLLRIKSSNYFGFGVAAAERTPAGGIWRKGRVKVTSPLPLSPGRCLARGGSSPSNHPPPTSSRSPEEVRAETSKKVEVRQEGKRVRMMPTQVEGQAQACVCTRGSVMWV